MIWPALITWILMIGIGLGIDLLDYRRGDDFYLTFAQIMSLIGIPVAALVGIISENIGFWRQKRKKRYINQTLT